MLNCDILKNIDDLLRILRPFAAGSVQILRVKRFFYEAILRVSDCIV